MIHAEDSKVKILEFLKINGPCLPVHVSISLGTSVLFASAFLSELLSGDQIRISNMKVGGSPVYFLPGQEIQLEKFSSYLKGPEAEAFNLLKENKVLVDEQMQPAIRVALRSIKDFAFPFKLNDKIYWRYFCVSPNDSLLELRSKSKPEKPRQIIVESGEGGKEIAPLNVHPVDVENLSEPKNKEAPVENKEELVEPERIDKIVVEKPLIKLKEKTKKLKEKSDFILKILDVLEGKNIEILDEIDFKKREYIAKVRVNSDVGKIVFLAIAKDKKNVTENDLVVALQKARAEKLPALVLSFGELNKKAKDYLRVWENLVRVVSLNRNF